MNANLGRNQESAHQTLTPVLTLLIMTTLPVLAQQPAKYFRRGVNDNDIALASAQQRAGSEAIHLLVGLLIGGCGGGIANVLLIFRQFRRRAIYLADIEAARLPPQRELI